MGPKRELIRVAASPEFMLNGVAVSTGGRVFASFPRWTAVAAPSVMEALPDGGFRPYPGDAWNAWRPGAPSHDRIVSSHAVYADASNHLWVVDDAAPRVAPPVLGAAKLVRFDLATDRVKRVYPLGEEILPAGTMIGHMRIDARFAYVTEAHHGAILVIDYGFPAREYYHPQRSMGTLMCHYRHRAHGDPFYLPGLQDITAHVDFSALAQAAVDAGLDVLGYASLASFLIECGITELLAETDPDDVSRYAPLAAQANLLLSPAEMGELFKVLAVGRRVQRPLAGFTRGDRSHTL